VNTFLAAKDVFTLQTDQTLADVTATDAAAQRMMMQLPIKVRWMICSVAWGFSRHAAAIYRYQGSVT